MSFRVGTPNYGLPQTEGTDKRDWSDTNQPFLLIDTAIKNAVDTSATASAAAATAQQTADNATTAATHAQTDATTAQTLATSASELATLAKTTADSAKSASTANTAAIAQINETLDKGSVQVTADGVKTYATLLFELSGLLDYTKLRDASNLEVSADVGTTHYECQQYGTNPRFAQFGTSRVAGDTSMQIQGINLNPTASSNVIYTRITMSSTGNTADNRLSEVPTSGLVIKVVY